MAEILEGHIREHVIDPARTATTAQLRAADESVDVVKAYLKYPPEAMFAMKATIDAGRSRMIPGCEIASSARHRRVRLRVAFLAIVCSLPGVWCAGHLLTHESESEHHALHAGMFPSRQIAEVSCGHDHEHSHPESPPAVSAKGTKKLDASVLLTTAAELDHSSARLQWHLGAARGHASQRYAAASEPRAPPIS
jgi:hypothetical protein